MQRTMIITTMPTVEGHPSEEYLGIVTAEGIRGRLDRATAEMEMVAGRLDKQMDEVLERNEIDLQLGERRRRLGITE